MEQRQLGSRFPVSALTLGGGGIAQVWGETTRDEAIATVHAAVAAGINLLDLAPMYGDGEAETLVGLAYADGYPPNVRVTTKCLVGNRAPQDIVDLLRASLDDSCARLARDGVDIYILHGYVVPDGWIETQPAERQARLATAAVPWSRYQDSVIPTFEALKAEGRIGAWGITAASVPAANRAALAADLLPDVLPDVVQCVANPLDSSGSMALSHEPPDHRQTIAAARARGVGVMGIRAVAAGALTSAIDREVHARSREQRDFDRAQGFRALAAELGCTPAWLAHRYALQMDGVDTVVLGVKNRAELAECVDAANAAPLGADVIARVDAACRAPADR